MYNTFPHPQCYCYTYICLYFYFPINWQTDWKRLLLCASVCVGWRWYHTQPTWEVVNYAQPYGAIKPACVSLFVPLTPFSTLLLLSRLLLVIYFHFVGDMFFRSAEIFTYTSTAGSRANLRTMWNRFLL